MVKVAGVYLYSPVTGSRPAFFHRFFFAHFFFKFLVFILVQIQVGPWPVSIAPQFHPLIQCSCYIQHVRFPIAGLLGRTG